MVINALNSGARVFMADFEDAKEASEIFGRVALSETFSDFLTVPAYEYFP
jgi:malate synthase